MSRSMNQCPACLYDPAYRPDRDVSSSRTNRTVAKGERCWGVTDRGAEHKKVEGGDVFEGHFSKEKGHIGTHISGKFITIVSKL